VLWVINGKVRRRRRQPRTYVSSRQCWSSHYFPLSGSVTTTKRGTSFVVLIPRLGGYVKQKVCTKGTTLWVLQCDAGRRLYVLLTEANCSPEESSVKVSVSTKRLSSRLGWKILSVFSWSATPVRTLFSEFRASRRNVVFCARHSEYECVR